MKRGFLKTQYAPGGTLNVSKDAPTATSALDRLKREEEQEKKREILAEQLRATARAHAPDAQTVAAELRRRILSSGSNVIMNALYGRRGLTAIFIWPDQATKLRFGSQYERDPSLVEIPLENRLSVRSSPTARGRSSVAARAVQAGELLLEDFPLLCSPMHWIRTTDNASLDDILQVALNALPPERQSTYRALYNAWSGYTGTDLRGAGELTGIFNTNAYQVDGLPGDDIVAYCAVFDGLSRINHSCRPNAIQHWDPKTATLSLLAVRPIAANEEVTISYFGAAELLEPAAARRTKLQDGYRFTCSCPACVDGAASDARRAELARTPARRSEFLRWSRSKDPKDETLIDKSKKVCELYEREQLLEPFGPGEHGWSHAVQLMNCYLALGMELEATFWANKVAVNAKVLRQENLLCAKDAAVVLGKSGPKSAPAWDLRRRIKEMSIVSSS